MDVVAQNINNTTVRSILQQEKLIGPNFTNWYRNLRIVLRSEGKLAYFEQPLIPLPYLVASQAARDAYNALYDTQNEVACLMLGSMSPELQRALENYKAYDMIQELKTMLEEQAKQELFEMVKAFHASWGRYAMVKLHEKGIPKKAETLVMLAIREGKIQKDKKKPQGAKGKDKGKNKLAYDPKPKILPPPKRDNPVKDSVCHHYKEGLRESRKLKHGALCLYLGDGMRKAVEAIGSFDLILPINVFYFNEILRDGIYEIDMHNLYPNVSSMFNVSNKRAKHALDSSNLWHCRLDHISKKCMDKLQRDGILQPTRDESLEKCKSCISGKMAQLCQERVLVTSSPLQNDFSRYGYVYLMKHKHEVFETFKLTPPYTLQNNGVSERRNQTLLDMVRSMMNLTTLLKSFWGYALESAARILNMVPTKKVEITTYEIWHEKVGYPKETMGYYFYYPLKNKIFIAQNAEFFENSLMVREASGSHGLLESSRRIDQGLGSTSGIRAFALRNFDLEVMEFESTHSNTTAKLPILKLGEYEMWVIRIKQYFQVQDYALWEVIENDNSWVYVPQTAQENAAIETRFGGNEATKKTQKTLLKQQYENFSASSIESLDSIFNRLQKIVSRLAILVWMNKADIETMSIDDLYNNFKIVKQDVKKSVGASSGAQNLASMTASSTSSTNDINTAKPPYEVSTVSPNVNTASPQDVVQIHEDDLEVMNLKWQLSLLSMRAKRYFQRTGKKIFINANDTAGYDKSKVECFNCHKMGHFARECRAPRNKEGQFKYQDNTRKQGNNEDTSSKAMLAIDGVGFDWSDMAEEQVQTNMALMAFSDSELNQTEFMLPTYKGFATVDEQIVHLGKNEVLFSKEVAVLKREVACKDYEINVLKSEFEKVKQEKEGIEFKIEKFDNASKSLNKLPEFKSYGSKDSKQESNIVYDKKSDAFKENSDDSLVKEQVSVSEDTSSFVKSSLNIDKETVFLVDKKVEFVKPKNHEKPVKKSVRLIVKYHQRKDAYIVNNYNRTVNTAHPKSTVSSAKTMLSFSKSAQSTGSSRPNAVKASAVSGCSRNMTGNIACLSDFKEFDKGYVTFGGGAHGGRISGKQLISSCKSKVLNPITKPLFIPYMDLFGPTFVSSLMHKKYCLVVTDDYNRFTWVFFLTTKDETSEILKNFIKEIENLVDKKVKIIRSDNGTKFKNKVMDDFCREKGIKREYSVARTPQQNGVAKRRNRTLIEAARTMLADSKLPTTFWAEAVSTACYVQNRVLVVKPHNKTPYELFRGFKPALSFMRPFGCHVTILNTLDNLGKFDGKSDEGFFVGYSLSSKAFRVYNTRTRRVEENLHIGFLENKPMIEGNGPKWLFDIDSLTQSMNYVPVAAGTITNESAGTQGELNAGTSTQKEEISQDCIEVEDGPDNENDEKDKSEDDSSPKEVNTARQHVNTTNHKVNIGSFKLNIVDPSVNTASSNDQDSPKDMFIMGASHTLEATHVEFFSDEDEPKVDLGNILNSYTVPTTPNTRIHKDHPINNVIGDVKLSVQTRRMTKPTFLQGFLSAIEPTSITKLLSDSSGLEAMQEELLQFKLQQGHRQEEGIDYKEVFAPVARIKAIRLFLAYATFMGFLVYQMDVKSTFLYGTIEEEVYVTQPSGFKVPNNLDKVYKVVKALYGLHQAPRACKKEIFLLVQVYVDDIIFGSTNKELCTGFEKLMKDKFQMSFMGELTFFLGLKVQPKQDGIFIIQDKYVDEILKKFNYTDVKSASTPVDLEKPLVKDGDANDVDVYLYRSMIGSLMYLTTSRPDIMFAYSRDSLFELVAYTDSDYARATQDRKSTTRGCQFLGNRLISWQCKKQTMVATSTIEAEYVAAANLLTKGFDAGRVNTVKISLTTARQKISTARQKLVLLSQSMSKEVGTPRYLNLVVPLKKVGDETVHKELGDRMEKAATTASSLEAEQESVTAAKLLTTVRHHLVLPVQVNAAEGVFINTSFQAKVKTVNGECQLQALVDKKRVIITESSIRSDLQLEDAGCIDCLPTATIFEELARMGRKPRKETEVPQDESHHDDSIPIPSNDPLLSGEDRMQLTKLMILCTNLQKQVLDLEKVKDAQAKEIAGLKKRVQKLERKKKSRTTRSFEDIDKDAEVSLVDETYGRKDDTEMFDKDDFHGDEVIVDMTVGEKQEQSAKVDEREVSTGVCWEIQVKRSKYC
ncbi:putative ribonuclease H-like domain-containing protein [Tanacetum coccineum]